ncbi:MAG: haloacid dehalogenase-like hydrolase [Planctomycetota bacterium]
MSEQLFPQTVIAVLWDFDRTLSPGYMQEPLFAHFDVDPGVFWAETNGLAQRYRAAGLAHVSEDTMYLNHMLTYVETGRFPGLDNALLRELGAKVPLYPGVPEIFARLRSVVAQPAFERHGITVEHHILSNGLYQMIAGSPVSDQVDGVWACEFIEDPAPPGFLDTPPPERPRQLRQLGYVLDNTTKTRAIFEINKGSNAEPAIGVNDAIPPEQRRVPMDQMIYVADGPTDIPGFSVVRRGGGRTYAVYGRGDTRAFRKAKNLSEQQRVDDFGEADYLPASHTSMWLEATLTAIAERIAGRRDTLRDHSLGKPPGHR